MVEHGTRRRVLGRKRRANAAGGRQFSHQVKVTAEEEAVLAQRAAAQDVSIPRLLVESATSDEAPETATERRKDLASLFEMYRLLANVANNVNQIAKATNTTREMQPRIFEALDEVVDVARKIDGLIVSMGMRR